MALARASAVLCFAVCSMFGHRADAGTWISLGPDGGSIVDVLASPADPARVYAVGDGGVFRSADSGAHWSRAETGLLGTISRSDRGQRLILDRDQTTTLYLCDEIGRVYRSSNSAESWTATGYTSVADVVSLIDLPGSVGQLLLATSTGDLLKSVDGGTSFAPVSSTSMSVAAIQLDPLNAAHLLVATVTDPPQLLFSGNAGATFVPLSVPPGTVEINDIRFAPNNVIYAIVNGNLWRTDNGGGVWAGPLGASGITKLAVDDSAPGKILVGRDGQLAVSTNSGLTQTPVPIGIPVRTRVTALAVQPNGAGPARFWLGSAGSGVIASEDNGTTWNARNSGLRSTPVRSVAAHPVDPQRLIGGMFIDANSGNQSPSLLSSSDRGGSWTSSLGELATYVRAVSFDPTTAANVATTHVYAVGRSLPIAVQNGGIYKSTDGGTTWNAADMGLGFGLDHRIGAVRNIVLDPRSCVGALPGIACSTPLQTLYATASGRGGAFRVVRSDDAGASWFDRSSGLPDEYDGLTYQSATPLSLTIDPHDRQILYIGTFAEIGTDDGSPPTATIPNGVFRSDDGGLSWQPRGNGLPLRSGSTQTAQDVFAMVAHPRRSGVLWAAATPPGNLLPSRVFKTIDGGANWSESSVGLDHCLVRAMQVDPVATDVIYATGSATDGAQGCVYRSEDGGTTWSALHSGLAADLVGAVQRDPQDQRRIVVGSNSGIWELNQAPDAIFRDGSED
ncbi:MAG: hypothetical protein ABI411_15800 [Tahibacter sp.]